MLRLWCFAALCCVLVVCEERPEDSVVEEDKILDEENVSLFGGTVLNNKFSLGTPPSLDDTSTMDVGATERHDEDRPGVTIVPSKEVFDPDNMTLVTVSNPPSPSPTHKIDPKRDSKKKNKSSFKKKDKNLDEDEGAELKDKLVETTTVMGDDTETVTMASVTSDVNSGTTETFPETTVSSHESPELLHASLNKDTVHPVIDDADNTQMDNTPVTSEGDNGNDKQDAAPHTDLFQTTMSSGQTMGDTMETNPPQTVTNMPLMDETTLSPRLEEETTTAEDLDVTENNDPTPTINPIHVHDIRTEILEDSGVSDDAVTKQDHTFTTAQEDEIHSK